MRCSSRIPFFLSRLSASFVLLGMVSLSVLKIQEQVDILAYTQTLPAPALLGRGCLLCPDDFSWLAYPVSRAGAYGGDARSFRSRRKKGIRPQALKFSGFSHKRTADDARRS